jgi:uncharacterized protein YabE (DUF348 family)
MNIPSKLDKLYYFCGKARYAFLAVFVLTIMFSSFVSHRVYGDSVVGTVETKISVNVDGKTKNIVTTQNTIAGALVQNRIELDKYDISKPPLDTYLSGKATSITITRALPVLISDNGQSWQAKSAYSDPSDILKQLAVEIYPEDKISAELILDPAADGAVGQKVIIERAPVYTVYVDDTTKVLRSWTKTVGEMLDQKGITLGLNDTVEPDISTLLTGLSEITITRINFADIEELVTIPYNTLYKIDLTMDLTSSRVGQEGVLGKVNKSYRVEYRNGVEVSRIVTNSETITGVQDKVVYKGAEIGRANFGYYDGMVTSYYRGWTGKYLLVTNLDNGKQVKVRIIGSGPFNGPLMDMGTEPFQMLGGTLSGGFLPNVAVQLAD